MDECDAVGHDWKGGGPEGARCVICGVTEAEHEQYKRALAARRRTLEKTPQHESGED